MTAAETCHAFGWAPGTTITSADGEYGILTLRITAIGEAAVLARMVGRDGSITRESLWFSFEHRFWREVVTA